LPVIAIRDVFAGRQNIGRRRNSTGRGRNNTPRAVVLRGMIEGRFAELIAGQRQGVLVTLRQEGWPQLSNVNYAWYPEEQVIRISTTDDRAKTSNMRRDPRVSFHVTSGDFWSYVVVDGHAELSAVARDPHDAAVEELVELYRAVQGDHPDWDDYRAAMVRDRRLVVRLRAERTYGMVHRG
jgi:PPOX class probable F420-dependent enzyme